MMPKRGLLGLALLMALLGTSDSAATEGADLELEVWVIGDSVGVGIASALRRANLAPFDNAEKSTTARQWAARLPNMSGPRGRRFVVVSLGTNDAQSAELRREFISNARAIVAELQRRGHVVCWVLPPSEKSLIPSVTDLERLMAIPGLLVAQERVDMADQWHPTAAGYDRLARVVTAIRRNAQ